MKVLVIFYSRHGHTKLIGKRIVEELGADVEEIIDLKDRKDVISWAESAFNSEIRKPTKIKKPIKDLEKYDLVIVGTPIWDGVAPAVKAYLEQMKFFGKIAFFATFGASAEDAFKVMSKISEKKPVATMGLQDREIILGEDKKLIGKFVKEIKAGMK